MRTRIVVPMVACAVSMLVFLDSGVAATESNERKAKGPEQPTVITRMDNLSLPAKPTEADLSVVGRPMYPAGSFEAYVVSNMPGTPASMVESLAVHRLQLCRTSYRCLLRALRGKSIFHLHPGIRHSFFNRKNVFATESTEKNLQDGQRIPRNQRPLRRTAFRNARMGQGPSYGTQPNHKHGLSVA